MLLALSLVALAVGPLVYQWASGRPRGLSFLDGFNVAAITFLVILAVLPHALEERDWLAVGFGIAGFLGPGAAERVLGSSHGTLHRTALLLGALVLAVHALSDGVILGEGGRGTFLPVAVLLHQVPVGLSLWWLTRRHGRGVVAVVFGGMVTATVIGFGMGPTLLQSLSHQGVQWFQAFVGGGLLHVIHHRVDPRHHCTETHQVDRRAELAGGLLAALAVALLLIL